MSLSEGKVRLKWKTILRRAGMHTDTDPDLDTAAVAKELQQIWPQLNDSPPPCPSCKVERNQELWALLVHLNDDHKWAFERIADWLDSSGIDLDRKGGENGSRSGGTSDAGTSSTA